MGTWAQLIPRPHSRPLGFAARGYKSREEGSGNGSHTLLSLASSRVREASPLPLPRGLLVLSLILPLLLLDLLDVLMFLNLILYLGALLMLFLFAGFANPGSLGRGIRFAGSHQLFQVIVFCLTLVIVLLSLVDRFVL